MSGCLVSKTWLQKVDSAVAYKGNDQTERTSSLFYDVRPAEQTSETWTKVGEVWKASFAFIVNDVRDDSFVFPAFAVTASTQPTTGEGTRVFVVWRGRWEVVGGGSGGGGTANGVSIATIEPNPGTVGAPLLSTISASISSDGSTLTLYFNMVTVKQRTVQVLVPG